MPGTSPGCRIAADSTVALDSGAHHPHPLMPAPRPPHPRRARPRRALVALPLVAAVFASAPRAEAENPATPAAPAVTDAPIAPPSPDLPGLPGTSIELAQVPVGGQRFEQAEAAYREVDGRHAAAQAARTEVDRTTSALTARLGELEAIKASSEARIAGLTARLETVEGAIQELAVESFVGGGAQERMNDAMVSENPAIHESERRDVLGAASMNVLLNERAAYMVRIQAAEERADQAATDLAEAAAALADVAGDRAPAVKDELAAAGTVAKERVAYEEARVLAPVDGVEFPLVALDAYYRAAGTVTEDRPACGVQWWALAGISKVEGRHGTYGGTTLLPNGDTSKRIIGIQLNGTRETAVIPDSDGGALDGDAQYDRAVGPMQFIPQTWKRFGADGNEDATTSPFNLYDATLAAANYLCTASRGLEADPGLRAAYFSYNRSLHYVDSVLGYARLYERSIEVPDPQA